MSSQAGKCTLLNRNIIIMYPIDIEELKINDKNQTSEESCEMADYCENSSLLLFDQFAQEFQTDDGN